MPTGSYNNGHKDVKGSVGNRVTLITTYGVTWALKSWRSLPKLRKLCCTPETNIALNGNCEKRKVSNKIALTSAQTTLPSLRLPLTVPTLGFAPFHGSSLTQHRATTRCVRLPRASDSQPHVPSPGRSRVLTSFLLPISLLHVGV